MNFALPLFAGDRWPFDGLAPLGYRVIYADPPWNFDTYSVKSTKSASSHYDCMTIEQLKALPVGDLAAPDCVLFCWATYPTLPEALAVIEAWGFRYATVAFTWAKRTALDTGWHMGLGYYTRANPEICILATAGNPGRPNSRAVRNLIVEPIRQHSRKPDRLYADIEALYDGPYLELFARTHRPGWASWGNEVGKFAPEPA